MRNLKRVLSLALAAIMLIGMMAFGTGAANVDGFKDANRIDKSNLEAATVVTGLKIMEGTTDGNFDPNGPVDRKTMATLIVKLLNGNDFNANIYKNMQNFNDVPMGAWYEGYINMCAGRGYVNGYAGTKNFGPDDTVTTYQASLLLQRALGYWDKNDPTPVNEMTVTARAGELGLYGNMNLQVNDKLTRQEVAVMVFNALTAQIASWNENRANYVKANDDSVAIVPGTTDPYNTLLYQVYHTYVVRGVVTANGMTDALLYSDDDTPGDTIVRFDELTDLNQDGRPEASEYIFNCDTGLNMIGHNADIYYQLDRGTPIVKAIVDKATRVKEIPYDDNTTRLNQAATAAGFRNRTILAIDRDDYQVNYDLSATATVKALGWNASDYRNLWADSANRIGKTLLVISNSADYSVDCVIVLDQKLDQVKTINRQGVYTLVVGGGNATSKIVVSTDGAQVDDYVISTDIGNRHDRIVIDQADIVTGRVSVIRGRPGAISNIEAGGVDYTQSPVFANAGQSLLELVNPYQAFEKFETLTLALDKDGKLIGSIGEAPKDPDYCYVAWYGTVHINPLGEKTNDFTTEALAAYIVCADGTAGVYRVGTGSDGVLGAKKLKTDGSGVATLAANATDEQKTAYNALPGYGVAAWNKSEDDLSTAIAELNKGVYIGTNPAYALNTVEDALVLVNKDGDAGYEDGGLGIWNYKIVGDTVTLTALSNDKSDRMESVAKDVSDPDNPDYGTDIKFVTGHSGVLSYEYTEAEQKPSVANITNVQTADVSGKTIWQDTKTVYFYVTGAIDGADRSQIAYQVGVGKMLPFTADVVSNPDYLTVANKTYVAQAFTQTAVDGSCRMNAVLVRNIKGAEISGPIYFYSRGTASNPNFRVEPQADGTFRVDYKVYDLDGNPDTLTYYFPASKVQDARNKETGFYEDIKTDMRRYAVLAPQGTTGKWTYTAAFGDTAEYATRYIDSTANWYVVNATAEYDERTRNLIDNVNKVGVVFDLDTSHTEVVDTCNSGLEELDDIVNAFKDSDHECHITISYMHKEGEWTTKTVFVTSYDPSGTQAPGGNTTNYGDAIVTENETTISIVSTRKLDYATVDAILRSHYASRADVSNFEIDMAGHKVTVVLTNGGKGILNLVLSGNKPAGEDEQKAFGGAAPAQDGDDVDPDSQDITMVGNTIVVEKPLDPPAPDDQILGTNLEDWHFPQKGGDDPIGYITFRITFPAGTSTVQCPNVGNNEPIDVSTDKDLDILWAIYDMTPVTITFTLTGSDVPATMSYTIDPSAMGN